MPSSYIENYQRVTGDKGLAAGREWMFYCPFPGCFGYRKRKLYVDQATGAWYCHHCQQERPHAGLNSTGSTVGGSVSDFIELMNDDPAHWPSGVLDVMAAKKVQPLTAKRRREFFTFLVNQCQLSQTDQEMITERGIDPLTARLVSSREDLLTLLSAQFDDDTIIRGGVAYPDRTGKLLPRHCISAGRILIPYYDNEQVYHFAGYMKCPKRRPDQAIEDYQTLRDTWPKVAGPAGYTPALYGDVYEGSPFVIITEGQLKAMAAIQQGLICIGLQGIMNGHAAVIKKLVEKQVQRAIICFDTQTEDQDTVNWAGEKLARELLTAGIPTYKTVLPLHPDVDKGQKMDIDSYLLYHGVAPFVQLLANAQPFELVDQEIEEDEATTDTNDARSLEGDE